MRLRKIFRKFLLPHKEIKQLLSQEKFSTCLDIGAGTGLFLEILYSDGFINEGTGIEINPNYFRKINSNVEIVSTNELKNKKFDIISFVDVLHHVDDKQKFIESYVNNYLDSNGCIFVKEMSPDRALFKYWNRFHDYIFAGQTIKEISRKNLIELLKDYKLIASGRKRIFLYDHYFCLFKKNDE